VVSASVSGRTGSTDVGIISGFSCATETGWNSGLADPNTSLSGFGAYILLPPVGNYFRFRFFGGSSAFPFIRPKDHGTGVHHYGRGLKLAGRRHGNRLANGRLATYYVKLKIRIHAISVPLYQMATKTG